MNSKIDLTYSATFDRFSQWKEQSNEFLNSDLNETETRSKIIDPLFKEVLGWGESQIDREGHLKSIGYYDYIFSQHDNRFVLEAKKEYVPFQMPVSRIVKAKTLKTKYSELYEAITQGVNYAVPKGINVVVALNGAQLAVTYVKNFHIPTTSDTYLFQSHNKISEDFISFFNLFSPTSKIEDKLIELLNVEENQILRARPSFSNKILQKQEIPADVLQNNQLASFLGSIHDRYFAEIINDRELLQKCYCDYDGAHQYEKNIEYVLRDRAPRLNKVVEDIVSVDEIVLEEAAAASEITDIKTKKKSADIFDGRFSESRNRSKMFLLIGGAGGGKTTFIHRFFNFILSEEDRNNTVWIYLDCKECAHDTNLDKYVYEKIINELYEKYNSMIGVFEDKSILRIVFASDLKKHAAALSFLKEEEKEKEQFNIIMDIIKNNIEQYVKRIFEYVQNKKGFSTCVVYDNVDQLDSVLQEKIFLHGNALKERLRTTVILSLREEVYYEHENDKSFNFSDCDVFHIPAPKVLNVLAKRLKAAKSEFKTEDVLFNIRTTNGMSITVKKLDIIEVLTQTFLGSNENTLLLEMISNRDVRESLRLFKRIVSSPNVNYDSLLTAAGSSAINSTSDKRVKYEELLRGLALDNRVHYSSDNTKLLNIFRINNDGFFSHFTYLRIFHYAQANMNLTIGNLPKGFFKLKDMYNECFKYTVKDIDSFLEICLFLQKEGAIINLKGTIGTINDADLIMLGPSGYYYLNFLKNNPYYLALVAIDTPIADQETVDRIEDLYQKSLNTVDFQRNRRFMGIAKVFANYLAQTELEEHKVLKNANCPNIGNPMYQIGEDIKKSIQDLATE